MGFKQSPFYKKNNGALSAVLSALPSTCGHGKEVKIPKLWRRQWPGSPKSGFFLFSVLEDSNWPHSYTLTTLDKLSFCSYVTASAADLMPLFKDLETLEWWFPVYKSRVVLCFLFTCHLGEFQNLIFLHSWHHFWGIFSGNPQISRRHPNFMRPKQLLLSSPEERLKRPKETRRRRGSGGRSRANTQCFKLKKQIVVDPN